MGEHTDAQDQDEGLIKKPMKGSFQRVGDRMAEELTEKTPSEAIRDDLGGPSTPTDEEHAHLEERVDQARDGG